MASFVADNRDRLTNLLKQRLLWVRGNLSRGPEPPPGVACGLIKETSDRIMTTVKLAPARVKKIVASAFSAMGWDAVKGVPVTRAVSMAKLAQTLETIIQELNNFNMSPVEPTAAEIGDISKAAARLWELDHNRLQPGEDYELDLQGEKNPSDHRDVASRPLFKSVSPDLLNKPTFKAFQALLDNYVADEGVVEAVTAEEKAENERFLNLLMDTAVMQYCHKVLVANRKAPSDRDGFIRLLETAWFGLYRRKIPNDSSGFEHVFLGEREPGKVVGLHNWLQLRSEEISGRLNYKGKIRPKRRPPAGYPVDQLITIQFEWCGEEKFMSSSLIGTSPEFEIALYTLCWASGNEETKVALGPHKIVVKAFSIQQKGGPFIGSAYPEEAPHDDEDMNRAARVIQKPFIAKRR